MCEFTSQLEKDQLDSLSFEKLDLSRRLTSDQLDQVGDLVQSMVIIKLDELLPATVDFAKILE